MRRLEGRVMHRIEGHVMRTAPLLLELQRSERAFAPLLLQLRDGATEFTAPTPLEADILPDHIFI